MQGTGFGGSGEMILRERDKPDDLTPEEWEWEKRILDWAVIAVGAATFVVLALLMASKAT